jgi:hypothetical protein
MWLILGGADAHQTAAIFCTNINPAKKLNIQLIAFSIYG